MPSASAQKHSAFVMKMIAIETLLEDYFSDAAKFAAWGRVEAALAQEQAALGMIPQEAADCIQAVTSQTHIDAAAVQAGYQQTGHVFIPYLRLIEEQCGEHGTWLHYGATTDNILFSALSLQLNDALQAVDELQAEVLSQLCDVAEEHKATVMAGRTHTQQALPLTFGYKIAGFLDECERHLERQATCRERCLRVMLGGAIGSFASFGKHGPALQEAVAKRLKLSAMAVPLRSINDAYAELGNVYALSAGTFAKIAVDFKAMCRSEVGELFQDDGSVGSSTMPQKRNPVLYNAVLQAYAYVSDASKRLTDIRVQADDGDSLSGLTQQADIVEVVRLYYGILLKMKKILDTLRVNSDKMRSNLQIDGGWIMAEALMLALAKEMGKTEAHDILHDMAMAARESGQSLRDAALSHSHMQKLGTERLDEIIDPHKYIGASVELSEQVIERLRGRLSAH